MTAPVTTALTRPEDLLTEGLVTPADMPALAQVAGHFRIRVTPAMRAAITAPADPVAAQFVPTAAELITRPEERADPIGDAVHSPAPGLTHRYPDRAILHITKTCDVYCRFCFRRETVGETGPLPEGDLEQALDYIAATRGLREIILTGGDPLTLSPRRLEDVLTRLSAIPHLTTLRFHSRVPVVAPERITPALVALLRAQRPAVWVVVHTNHAQELTAPARAALARLVEAGVPLLSQSVLLKGVNDSHDALRDLFRALQDCRVKPYYLHHCDLAQGTGHFRTTIVAGRALMAGLRGHLSGAAIPTYVLDIPGGFGKVPITADHLAPGARPGLWRVTDWQGGVHDYADPAS
ncbi:lysine-2,3-aminomutase-like protein [Rhodobacter capsulatus]|uniref:lysine-2,3-aminomutase-like protein n=1 Tax=Rhodobacter capsulatus TaxID=1061 RepID=UPI0006DC9D54|nr:lysine-2,3-aminomutase-like protein [Rhodobacter capsulatus]KQB13392.1 lysine 2,3-aminomutase [Rhodobacter capsulatus]KQB13650.1 lysine 2,3-aminomutase [Rhodobacter capsulatus]PZX24392.1 lysine 2,3-aminomutase [Rhodobacter capsulatus]QNR63635.1 lysine-2,3-aminomutase-like protein [Rhodobacter capsulatus]